jgi:nucleotide-binding universal stress UspA family protein
MLKHVLVALDETRDSRVALQHAVDLARAQRGRLHLVTVAEDDVVEPEVETEPRFSVDLAGPMGDAALPLADELEEASENGSFGPKHPPVLEDAREICEHHGVAAGLSVLSGRPADRLARKLRVTDALVLGRGGSTSPGSVAVGSCARDMIRSARKPVLVTGHEYREPNGVMAVYDGTDAGQRALQVAGELCTLENRDLHVACCGRDRDEQFRHQHEAEEYLGGYGLNADVRRADAEAEEELLSAASEAGVSALAVPRHEGLLQRLRPTLAERLVTDFRGPVWVVR